MTLAITKDFDQGECPPAYVETLLRAGRRIAAAPFEMMLGKIVVGKESILAQPGEGHAGGKAVYDCMRAGHGGDAGAVAPQVAL